MSWSVNWPSRRSRRSMPAGPRAKISTNATWTSTGLVAMCRSSAAIPACTDRQALGPLRGPRRAHQGFQAQAIQRVEKALLAALEQLIEPRFGDTGLARDPCRAELGIAAGGRDLSRTAQEARPIALTPSPWAARRKTIALRGRDRAQPRPPRESNRRAPTPAARPRARGAPRRRRRAAAGA